MSLNPITRRVGALTAIAAVGLSLAACGTDSAPAEETAASSASAETHDVVHARGTTAVPADPQRVVVLEPVQLDTAVALGKEPVGTTVVNETTGVPAYLGEDAADIEQVGTVMEPSLEKIAALEPDLIIGTESRHSALYDQLNDVAPTVFMATQADPWQENVALVAEALGDAEGASDLLADYEARCQEIADTYDTAGTTAQLIRPRDTRLTLYGPISFAGSTLECTGLTIPEHEWEDISLDISPENVLDAEADLVLVTTDDVDDPSTMPEGITANPEVFDNTYLVDFSYWIAGVGPHGGMAVLDDLEEILADQ
ncbi:ABC transporter substrate-binding protein [Zhihengliuella flava]|uniref:Iron complex transport system substrate-binding protein n=1 Tax=Zhihengliuella flava TaxID=1285193 RepID=A0A931GFE1_9MICC|nr:iron-siderophore ABC transporter substrate-binding protein [Zhihengliuella flava]MBG6085293.1 iron complex transport system substrate-binding protein [Zhihengliuella flava]